MDAETVYPGLSLVEIDREVALSRPGAGELFCSPHFEGAACPYWNPQAKGCYRGLTLSDKPGGFCQVFFESVAFEVKNVRNFFPPLNCTGGNPCFWRASCSPV